MPTLVRSITINALAEKVDKSLVDPAHSAEIWSADSAEPDAHWPEPGGKLFTVNMVAGVPLRSEITVLERVPGQMHKQRITSLIMGTLIKGTMKWTYTLQGKSTQLTMSVEYDVLPGVLGRVLDKLVMQRAITKMAEKI